MSNWLDSTRWLPPNGHKHGHKSTFIEKLHSRLNTTTPISGVPLHFTSKRQWDRVGNSIKTRSTSTSSSTSTSMWFVFASFSNKLREWMNEWMNVTFKAQVRLKLGFELARVSHSLNHSLSFVLSHVTLLQTQSPIFTFSSLSMWDWFSTGTKQQRREHWTRCTRSRITFENVERVIECWELNFVRSNACYRYTSLRDAKLLAHTHTHTQIK